MKANFSIVRILQHRGPQSLPRNQPIQPTLRLGGGGGNIRDEAPKVMDAFVNAEGGGASTINRPMSSGSALDYSIPLKSRYTLLAWRCIICTHVYIHYISIT